MDITEIGFVKNNSGKRRFNEWNDVISKIVICDKYQEALYRLEEFSHIYVIYVFHLSEESFLSKIHPTRNKNFPLVGAFATRTPNRPSKVGLTLCRLISIENNVLTVKGLDALNNSPVLDIKPYFPISTIENIILPKWASNLKKYSKSIEN